MKTKELVGTEKEEFLREFNQTWLKAIHEVSLKQPLPDHVKKRYEELMREEYGYP